jgi:penicillin-binding protein 1A
VAAPIFRDFMKEALKDALPTPFRVAPGIEEIPIDWKSGTQVAPGTPGAIMEAFKAGTAPGDNVPSQDDQGVPGNGAASVSQGTTPPPSVGEGTGGLY